MRLDQQKYCQVGLKRREKMGWNEEGCWKDFFDSIGHEHKIVLQNVCYASRKGENGPDGDSDVIRTTTRPVGLRLKHGNGDACSPRTATPAQMNIIVYINIDRILFPWQQCSKSTFSPFHIELQNEDLLYKY